MIKRFLKNNSRVFSIYFLVLFTALYFIFNYDKVGINVYLNKLVGVSFVDNFFFYITYLGDGNVAIVLLLGIILYNIRLGICATLSFLTAGLVTNSLKYFFFSDINRPFFTFQYIEKQHNITFVDGIDLHIHNSFPSGHATQAFAIFMCLVFAAKKQNHKFIFLGIALLTAFSRVYLQQHWLEDITAGSVIGFTFSLLFEYLIVYKNKLQKLNKSVFAFRKRA